MALSDVGFLSYWKQKAAKALNCRVRKLSALCCVSCKFSNISMCFAHVDKKLAVRSDESVLENPAILQSEKVLHRLAEYLVSYVFFTCI